MSTKESKEIHFPKVSTTSIKSRRTLTVIPLLQDNSTYRQRAMDFVNEHLQFSINSLHLENYTECTSNYERSIFASEVVKCMIMSDIYAKKIFYEDHELNYGFFQGPMMELEDYGKVSSENYAGEINEALWQDNKNAFLRYGTYQVLSSEDNALLANEGNLHTAKPEIQVACLTDKEHGLLGFIYTFLKNNENEYDIFQEMFYLPDLPDVDSGKNKEQPIKVLEVYGIRSSVLTKERNVAQSLIMGLAKYARTIDLRVIYVNRTPLGPMFKILEKLGFNEYRYVDANTVDDPDNIKVVDMGCSKEILQPDSEWLHLNKTRPRYRFKQEKYNNN